ncbi:MAG TPA: diacylglycerol kinase family protein [Ramlibacter sp.]
MWAAHSDDAAPNRDASAAGPELFIVINPGSGAGDAQSTRDTLARVFGAAGRKHRIVAVAGPGNLARASETAAQEAHAAGGALVAVGGDGTINTVAAAAWREQCPLGVLPQGTFNLFGRNQGIAQDLEQAARGLLGAAPEPVQVGEVNGRLFLVNASVGLYPQLLEDREGFKQQLGRRRWVAILSGLTTLVRWRHQLTLEIVLDGDRARVVTPTLFVGNNRLQLERIGIDPAIAARVGEGRLAAVMPRPIGTWSLLGLVLRGALGRLGEAREVRSFAFHTLTVQVLGTRRLKVAADGEVGTSAPPLRFTVSARPLVMLVPAERDKVPVA